MTQLVVRNLEQSVKTKLQRRAKRHGRSMEGGSPGNPTPRCQARGCRLNEGQEIREVARFYQQTSDFEE